MNKSKIFLVVALFGLSVAGSEIFGMYNFNPFEETEPVKYDRDFEFLEALNKGPEYMLAFMLKFDFNEENILKLKEKDKSYIESLKEKIEENFKLLCDIIHRYKFSFCGICNSATKYVEQQIRLRKWLSNVNKCIA